MTSMPTVPQPASIPLSRLAQPARAGDGLAGERRRSFLPAENFDRAGALAPEPEVIEPRFTLAELEAAKAEGHARGEAAGRAAAIAAAEVRAAAALAALAAGLRAAAPEPARIAEAAAAAAARLLLAALGTAWPALAACHGPAEAEALAAALLPHLRAEPRLTVRLSPSDCAALGARLRALAEAEGFAGRLAIEPAPALARGDVRIAWSEGAAARDHAALWHDITTALAPLGLAPVVLPAPPPAPDPDPEPPLHVDRTAAD